MDFVFECNLTFLETCVMFKCNTRHDFWEKVMNKKMHHAGYADTLDTQITLHILQIVQLQMVFLLSRFSYFPIDSRDKYFGKKLVE